MSFIPPEVVSKAKQMDLYTYLKTYEPQELVHFGGSTYCTHEHDSLKISNGKWYWFSRGIGGRSALDYLIKVKGIPFMEAVEVIVGRGAIPPPFAPCAPKENKVKSLCLPEASRCATHAVNYLAGRGIDHDLLDFCLSTGRLYESQKYHNVVFVGQDRYGKPRYANLRGIGTDFKGEASGSDKRFSFSIPAAEGSDTLHLFESAIDLLSYVGKLSRGQLEALWRALAISIGETGGKDNNIVMCLCKSCADNFRAIGKYKLRYVAKEQKKDTCTYCNYRKGFDYELVPKE